MAAGTSTPCPRCGTRLHGAFLGKICPRCALEGAGAWDEPDGSTPPGSSASVASERWEVGARVGDYELIDVLGRGGMAVVYLARHISLDRLVALKTISAPMAADAHGQERFRREARAIAQLEHPRIVSIHDIGTSGGAMYYTMDYIAGPDLGRAMRRRPIPIREAATIVQKIAEAVAHANERGVFHRDLKPGNILLDEAGEPHVTDFGIALEGESGAALTLTGDVMGTPPYMAPEALEGGHGKTGPASEVYALGAILFHLLTGRTPFTGTSPSEILHLAMTASPPSPRLLNPAVARDLETICLKCLEKSAESRYATAGQLADDLRRFLAGEDIIARPIPPPVRFARWARRRPAQASLLALLVVAAIGATLAAFALERERERAVAAETQAREQLFAAQLARAAALHDSQRPGQRTEALAALADAAKVKVTSELRNAAIVALAEWDMETVERGPMSAGGNVLAFSPTLEDVAVQTAPGVVEVKAGLNGATKVRLESGTAAAVAEEPLFSPDAQLLLTRHADKQFRLWSLNDGRAIATLPANAWDESVLALDHAWRPDAQEFVVTRAGGGLTFYSRDGTELRQWQDTRVPEHVRYSSDGVLLAAVTGKDLVVLDSATLAARSSLQLASEAQVISWQAGSSRLAVGCADGRIRVLDAARGALEQELVGHRGAVLALGYAPDGATLISSSRDTTTRWWDLRRGETLIVRPGDSSSGHVAFSADGTRAGMSTHQWVGTIVRLIRPTVVREIASAVPENRGSLVGALDFTRDGSLIAVATWNDVRVIDTTSGRAIASFPVPGDKMEECSAIFAPDGRALYISSVARGLRRHARAADGSFGEGEILSEEKDWLLADIAEEGPQLVLVNRKAGAVKIADAKGAALRTFSKHPNVMFTALSPDRKWLATQASGRGKSAKIGARVWSLGDEALAHEFPGGPLGAVTFSADGRWFASSGMEQFHLVPMEKWDAPIRLPEGIGKAGALVSFAADGELVAITTDDKTHLFHPATGAQRGTIGSPGGDPSTARARLSPDGRKLAVMWDDGSFDLWDLARLREELAALGIKD